MDTIEFPYFSPILIRIGTAYICYLFIENPLKGTQVLTDVVMIGSEFFFRPVLQTRQ
jgi:hypothetical protein